MVFSNTSYDELQCFCNDNHNYNLQRNLSLPYKNTAGRWNHLAYWLIKKTERHSCRELGSTKPTLTLLLQVYNEVRRPKWLLLHAFVRHALSRSFDEFYVFCFCSGFSLEDFEMMTELSRLQLRRRIFKTLVSKSYLIIFLLTSGFLWLALFVILSSIWPLIVC